MSKRSLILTGIFSLFVSGFSNVASAVTLTKPSAVDPRLQTVAATSDIIKIKVEIGRVTEIVLRPGETVKEYVFGDREAWWYADRDHVIRIKPKGQIPDTNVRIVTNRSVYWFDLDSTMAGPVAYQVTIIYPQEPAPTVSPKVVEAPEAGDAKPVRLVSENELIQNKLNQPLNDAFGKKKELNQAPDSLSPSIRSTPLFTAVNPNIQYERMASFPLKSEPPRVAVALNDRYAIVGSSAIEPQMVKDNGNSTFIKFSPSQPLPAIFYVAPDGQEARVNYSFQDDVMVVHRVAERFVLRHNAEVACLINLNFKPVGQQEKTSSGEVVRVIKGGEQ